MIDVKITQGYASTFVRVYSRAACTVFQKSEYRRIVFQTYGTSGLGLDLTAKAWPSLTQVFVSSSPITLANCPGRPTCPMLPTVDRLPKETLRYALVEPKCLDGWCVRVRNADQKPKLILEFWDPSWVLKETGPMAKRTVTMWSKEGYQTMCRTLNGLQVGGVVDCWAWLVVARIPADALTGWVWPHFPELVTRPMSNCLRPTGVPWQPKPPRSCGPPRRWGLCGCNACTARQSHMYG
jgi:hypothetical protein